jgi:hypothetical protein
LALAPAAHGSQKAAAESLFQEGKRLMDAGRYDEACPKFEASHKAEPSVGAMLNLARCHELAGKTASAWVEYKEAAKLAQQTGQADREQGARELASKLEATLSKLTIQVSGASEGMVVKRGDDAVPPESWGSAIAVDPGTYTIEASAPGKENWSDTVTVGPNGDQQTIVIPELAAGSGPGPEPDGDGGPNALVVAGYVTGGIGVVVLALGIGAGIVAINKQSDLDDRCVDPPDNCPNLPPDEVDDAKLVANLSTAGVAVGSVLTVAGIVMLVVGYMGSESSQETAVVPLVGPTQFGLGVVGRF